MSKFASTLLVITACLVAAITYFSANKQANADPILNLLVSEAMIKHGSPSLAPYQGQTLMDVPFERLVERGVLVRSGTEFYNYYPPMPSLLAIPVVAAANAFGWQMATHNFALQQILATATSVAALFLAFRIARLYLPPLHAWLCATVVTLGSGFVSSLGIAFWTLNYTTLLLGVVLYWLARAERNQTSAAPSQHLSATPFNPYVVGTFIFLAFACRPSSASFIVVVFVYLLLQHRRQFVPVALTSFILLVLLLGYNTLIFGEPLSSYYRPAQIGSDRLPLWIGVLGNLVSPSRGVLFFMPYLLVLPVAGLLTQRPMRRSPLVWMVLAWFALHLIAISRAVIWWGGYSYGPRLLTDVQLGLFLLLVMSWGGLVAAKRQVASTLFALCLVGLGTWSVWVHSYRGLYAAEVVRWNRTVEPVPTAPDEGLGEMFSVAYAQWAATEQSLCRMQVDRARRRSQPPQPVPYDTRIAHNNDDFARFFGWSEPSVDGIRWSTCTDVEIVVAFDSLPPTPNAQLVMTASALDGQLAHVALNGTPIGSYAWPRESEQQAIVFDANLLVEGVNRFAFELPEAHRPEGSRDQRLLGMNLIEMQVVSAETTQP